MTNVTITSAVPLAKAQLKAVGDAVAKKYGKDIELEEVVDPSVIGGVRVTIGSRQVDATTKHKLTQLKNQLLSI